MVVSVAVGESENDANVMIVFLCFFRTAALFVLATRLADLSELYRDSETVLGKRLLRHPFVAIFHSKVNKKHGVLT